MPGKKGGNGNPGGGGGGGDGPLYLSGNKKANTLTGGDYGDWINGKAGDDTLYGGLGDDELLGADGDDILYGEGDNDGLHGGDGDDELYGGEGNDLLQGGAGADIMDGGNSPGDPNEHDIASFVEVFTIDPVTGYPSDIGLVFRPYTGLGTYDYETDAGDLIVDVEQIRGTNYNDIMIGSTAADYYVGARGNDVMIGNAGQDTLYGSLDDDTIYAGSAMLDASNNVTSSANDMESDQLIFLRYADRYFDDDDNLLFENVFGDGVDTVYNFDPLTDTIHFLSDIVEADGTQIPDFDAEDMVFAHADGAVIQYAPGSEIILVGVDPNDIDGSHFSYEFVDV